MTVEKVALSKPQKNGWTVCQPWHPERANSDVASIRCSFKMYLQPRHMIPTVCRGNLQGEPNKVTNQVPVC